FLVVDLDLGARVLPEQDLVAGLHVEGDLLAVLANLTVADGDDLGFLRLLLGGVRNDDPALFDLFLLEPLDEDAVMQRTNLHGVSASFVLCWCRAGCLAVGLAIPSPREPFSTQVKRVLMYRGPKSRASGKIRKRNSMSKSCLVSNVSPAEALALIPNEIAVDYHNSQAALPRLEFIARLRGKDGLVCHIVSAIDDEVLAAAPTVKVVANVAVGYNNIDVAAA